MSKWVLPTSKSGALNVEMISRSLQRSRSFSRRRVIPTSQSAANPAVRQEKQTEEAELERICKSILQFVLNVARKLKYRLNPDRADRSIAVPAIIRYGRIKRRNLETLLSLSS
jgi:hypothetical protein